MALKLKVDECSFGDGRVHLRGWCFDDRLPIQKVEAVFPDPLSFVPLVTFGMPSPDVAQSVSPEAGRNRFDESIAFPARVSSREFRLQFTLSDGTIVLGEFAIGTPNSDPPSRPVGTRDIDEIRKEIEAVTRREAEFRVKMVTEFLDIGGSTYLHVLRQERAALVAREQEASAKLETLTRLLELEGEKVAGLEREIEGVKGSMAWRLAAPLRALLRNASGGAK